MASETRSVNLSIWIAQSVERVYMALTAPDQLEKWLVPKIGVFEDAPRRLTFVYPHHQFDIEFVELRPNELVTLTWFSEGGIGPRVTFAVEAAKGGTLVRLSHDGFDADRERLETFIDHVEGWTMYLCNLRCYLDAGFDLRDGQPGDTIAM